LANGESLTGTVTAITPGNLTLASELGDVPVEQEVVKVVKLTNPMHPAPRAGDPPRLWLEMKYGSRLLLSQLKLTAHTFRLTRYGQADPTLLADEHVTALEVDHGRWRWLDRMPPVLDEHKPFMTVRWPTRFGLAVTGTPLRIAGRGYAHGIGVHSRSRLVWDLDGARRFRCTAGLDDSAGPRADVDIAVLVDGRVEFQRKGVKLSDGAIPIDVRTVGGEKLELRVNFGANGDVLDRFNWSDAGLVY
jgi:hypothetical protein